MDIEEVTLQRIEMIQTENPDLSTKYDLEEDEQDEWCIITILDDNDRVLGYEFVETLESWKRKDALFHYNDMAKEGFRVAVVVPDKVFEKVADMLDNDGDPNVELFSYTDLGVEVKQNN